MKKIILTLALIVTTLVATADNTLLFTHGQAARTVAVLNNQDELMIYCGYEDELPTYCLVNEVWAEQISSSFFEIWLYGWDAYTGDEIYMPIDLECIYLVRNGHMFSAAQYLRFRYTHKHPTFIWSMPPYHTFVRYPRPHTYYYSYHYDIHRPGWHYCNYGHMHYHPYYRRLPHHPAPMHTHPFHPGKERPGYSEHANGGYTPTNLPLVGNITTSRSQIKVQYDYTNRDGSRITSNRGDNTITTTDRRSGSRTTTAAPDRNDISSGRTPNNGRGNATSTSTSRGNATDNGRGNTTSTNTSRGNGSDNGRGNATSTNTSRGNGSDNSRGNATSTNTSRSNANDNSRGNATSTSTSRGNATDNSRGNATSTSTSRSNTTDNSRGNATSTSTSRSNATDNSRGNATSTSTSRSNATDNSRGSSTSSSSNNSRSNNEATSTTTNSRSNNSSRSSSTTSTNNSRGNASTSSRSNDNGTTTSNSRSASNSQRGANSTR